jgi:UDP-N-acetylmuramoyl-L-alanyl-D-glutamate--2,6-diaminopimelate ligase
MASVTTPPGRTVAVDAGQPFKVIVDFAHTPAEFEAVLGGQRTDSGRVIAVFGSAGERDVQKRQLQGQVADRYADVIVLTEEDDRGEEASEITEQIAAGCREKTRGQTLFVEPDRSRAIRLAVGIAAPGDTVFLLGKGHESTIITARTTRTWSEEASARAALRHRGFG